MLMGLLWYIEKDREREREKETEREREREREGEIDTEKERVREIEKDAIPIEKGVFIKNKNSHIMLRR